MRRAIRLLAVLAGAIALSELSGFVTGGHRALPVEVVVTSALASTPAVLFAVALVLVYRVARIINFAQVGVAAGAALVFLAFQGQGWPYIICAALAVGFAVIVSVAIDLCLLRRFTDAPRLVATVSTIAAGQIASAIGFGIVLSRYGIDPTAPPTTGRSQGIPNAPATSLVSGHRWRWGAEVLTGDHVIAVVVAGLCLLALTVFFLRSNAGIAIRGAAENREKAATIGINTASLATLTWAASGALVGLFVITSLPMSGLSLVTVRAGFGIPTLLAGLAAGVVGGMDDLAVTAVAALGLSTFTQAVYFSTTSSADVEVVLLVVLGITLLARRGRFGRVEATVSGGWAAAEEMRQVPAVLRSHPAVRSGRRWAAAVGLLVLFGYPFAMSPSQVVLGGTFAIYGIVAVSLVVLTGWGGQISLGQFAFVAAGASVSGGLTAHGWPFPIGVVVATLVGGAIAIVVGLPALRLRGLFLAVMTLAFAGVAVDYFLDPSRFPSLTPGRVPRPHLFIVDFNDDRAFYFLALAGLGLAIFVALGLRHSRTGRVLIAMRDNERAAQAVGLSLVRVRLLTFAISGALAAVAGALFAAQHRTVSAAGYGVDASIQIFLMAVIGGLGSVTGVLTGAVYLACVQLFISSPPLQQFLSGAGVALVLLFFPSGLGGAVYALRDAFLRRIALRDRIFVPSLLGELRSIDGEEQRARLGARIETGVHAVREHTYVVPSTIAEAGRSQRGRGWIYG